MENFHRVLFFRNVKFYVFYNEVPIRDAMGTVSKYSYNKKLMLNDLRAEKFQLLFEYELVTVVDKRGSIFNIASEVVKQIIVICAARAAM